MLMWKTEAKNGVVVATYTNPPMNYFCAEGTTELADRRRGRVGGRGSFRISGVTP
jgi:hypothetical protein